MEELFAEVKASGWDDTEALNKLKDKSACTLAWKDACSTMGNGAVAPTHIILSEMKQRQQPKNVFFSFFLLFFSQAA